MMTLLGSLIGFGASAFPELLKLKREKEDRKQQLALLDRQIEQQKLGHIQKLEELNVSADIKEMDQVYGYANRDSGVRWVEALQSSVRPVITYAFFGLFAAVKLTSLATLLQAEGMTLSAALQVIWDGESQALFSTVLSFWFGARALGKAHQRLEHK
jgi:hypothetical protein